LGPLQATQNPSPTSGFKPPGKFEDRAKIFDIFWVPLLSD
jgi:hypothetical protein